MKYEFVHCVEWSIELGFLLRRSDFCMYSIVLNGLFFHCFDLSINELVWICTNWLNQIDEVGKSKTCCNALHATIPVILVFFFRSVANQTVRFHLKYWNEFKFIRLKFVTDAHIKRFPVCKLQFVWWLLILTKRSALCSEIKSSKKRRINSNQQQNKTASHTKMGLNRK